MAAVEDIAPALLEKLQKDFRERVKGDKKLQDLLKLINEGKATYIQAEELACKMGEVLSQTFGNCLSSATLPDGKMYYNIAQRVVAPMLREDHQLIAKATVQVQAALNKKAGIGLKPQTVAVDEDRVYGIVNKISEAEVFDDVAWMLGEPVVNFSQAVVDSILKANVDFQGKAGMTPKIFRKAERKCCKWCSNLAGEYDYPMVPDDVYRRHERCRCTVDYDPGDGRRQNVHTKQWKSEKSRDNIKISNGSSDTGITEQARSASHKEKYGGDAIEVDKPYIQSQEYRMRFRGITESDVVDDKIADQSKRMLNARSGTKQESLVILNAQTGGLVETIFDSKIENGVTYAEKNIKNIQDAKERGVKMVAIHNHPEGLPPTADDCASAREHGYQLGVVCGHNGVVYTYKPAPFELTEEACEAIHNNISYQCGFLETPEEKVELWMEMMRENGLDVERR